MKTLDLQRYDAASSVWHSVYQYWQSLSVPVLMGSPPPGAVLTLMTTANGHELLVDLRAWFSHEMPEKSGLRADLISQNDIRDMFHYSGASLSLNMPGEVSESLSIVASVDIADYCNRLMSVVNTSAGDGWLLKVSKHYHHHLCQHLPSLLHGGIRLRLNFILGHSTLSLYYLKKVNAGDVLLINQSATSVMIGNRIFAKYRKQEDYIMLEDIYQDEIERHSQTSHNTLPTMRSSGIKNIPIELTFVINQMTLTLAELSNLHIGDAISISDGGENSISIYANGSLLAKGELVEIAERIGVKIQTLCHEAQHGE